MADSFTYDVFLSHNRQDKPRVRALAQRLKEAGLQVWLDDWVIKPGDDIYLAIEHGLEAARVQVLCLSPAALGSDWVALERSTVLFRDPSNAGRRFVPLLLDDCTLPDTLRRYKYVDFRQGTQAGFEELLDACRSEAEAAPMDSREQRGPESSSDDDAITMQDLECGVCRAPTSSGKDGIRNAAIVRIDVAEYGKPDVYIQDRKYSTIQEAVDSGKPYETITLGAGTYKENLRIDKPFTIEGAGEGKTIIDGSGIGSVIIVGKNRSNINVTLTGMTIKGGIGTKVRVDDNDPNAYICGGGIINYSSSLTVADSIISGNSAHYGGGIFNKGTIKLEKGASVAYNIAYDGGGIYGNRGLINLNGGTVANNEAEQRGGGIYIGYRGKISIASGAISNNIAKNMGGGIYSQGGPVTLRHGTIFSNEAFSSGGGIYCSGLYNHLNGGTIHSNTARNGAGAVNGGGKITLNGTRIHSNTADRNGYGVGGGIMNSGTLILNTGSIDHNHASKDGGGILNTGNGKWIGDSALVHDNTLGNDRIPDDIAPL